MRGRDSIIAIILASKCPEREGAPGRGRPRRALAGLVVGCLLLSPIAAAPGGPSATGEEGEPSKEEKPRTLPDMEKDLRQAMASGDTAAAMKSVDEIAALGSPAAVEAIARTALTGVNYEVEKRAGAALVALSDPKARGKVLEGVRKNPNFKTRIILLAVVARWADDPGALAAIHAALKDPSKPVVLAALYWIRKLGKKESVEPLIAELESRERRGLDRVYFDVQRALRELTGVKLDASADWKNFWEAQKKGIMTPPKPGGGRTAVVRHDSFFSVMVDSDRVLFVIDVSGSMSKLDPYLEPPPEKKGGGKGEDEEGGAGRTVVIKKKETPDKKPKRKVEKLPPSRERLYRVRQELIRVVSGLQPATRFGIIAFNHEVKSLWERRVLKNATGEAKTAAINWVRAFKADGATRTDLALDEALGTPEVDMIILLTDGAPQDEKNHRLPIAPILARAKEQNRFVRARIATVSFAQIRDRNMRTFVRQLAAENDGGEPTLLP